MLALYVLCLSVSVLAVALPCSSHTYMGSHQMSESFTVLAVTADLKEL